MKKVKKKKKRKKRKKKLLVITPARTVFIWNFKLIEDRKCFCHSIIEYFQILDTFRDYVLETLLSATFRAATATTIS